MKLNFDAPIIQKMTLLTDLIALNFLWIICSIPIVTAGAATAALYDAMFRCIRNQDDTIFLPFFKAFAKNFRQATIVWLPLLVYLVFMVLDSAVLLSAGESGLSAVLSWIPFAAGILLAAAFLVYYFPMAARYSMKIWQIIKSSLAFTVMHPLRTLFMLALTVTPFLFFYFSPAWFLRLGFIWALIWFSAAAYLNTKILLHIFARYSEEEAALEQLAKTDPDAEE